MTPRMRTVTSGLYDIANPGDSCLWKLRKLKCRTLNGQLLAQYRGPTQRLYAMSFRPSGLCVVAATGQTFSHGAFSHCMQGTGCSTSRGSSSDPTKYRSMRIQ